MDGGTFNREHWSGRLGFVLAAAGSAIGLGNIWKFPYVAGENGGGAFVLIYLLCIAVIGLPVMLCEISIGRNTQLTPVGAFKKLTPSSSASAHIIGGLMVFFATALVLFGNWGWGVVSLLLGILIFRRSWTVVGLMGVVAGFMILSFYSVVAGWIIGYIEKSVMEMLTDVHLVALLSGLKDDPGHNSPVHVLTLASLWGIFIRFISPTAILIAFLYTIGWIKIGN